MTARLTPVAVTGMGAVSALGHGLDAMWEALAAGRDGMRPIERFSTEGFTTHLGGMVPVAATLGIDDVEGTRALCIRYAIDAGREALGRAGVSGEPGERVALVLGTSMGSHLGELHVGSSDVAQALGVKGPVLTVSTACASSTNALGLGRDLLDAGAADVVLAGGSDVLCPEIFAGFHALGLLSPAKCAPFSESMGTTLGEGAGFLVLESQERAVARGAPAVAWLSGWALSADGYHATSPEPSGAGVARALRGALHDAALEPGQVGYVNAHGTGTAANDPAEWAAIASVLGAHAERTPVSSTKSYLAHAQGAAGVLEVIATLLALQRGRVPPTLHLSRKRRRAPADPVGEAVPRPHLWEHALSTNSAFGGANAAVCLSRRPTPRPAPAARQVYVSGLGVVGPFGLGLEALARFDGGAARLAELELEALAPTAETRGMDQTARALTAAVALALADGKLSVSGERRERTGIFVGTTNASPAAWEEFRRSVRERGLLKLSAPAFTRLVLNAAAGTATRVFGLRGPTTTLTVGQGSGLLALALAAAHLAGRTDATHLIAAGVDEADLERRPSAPDAAAALVLGHKPHPGAVRVCGWAVAGPGQLEQARALACERAAVSSPRPAPRRVEALATGSLLAAAEAVGALRAERGAFLVTDTSCAASCAVVLQSE